jgi:hypothetical protein
MGDDLVGHYPTMPSAGKTSQAVLATRCFEDRLHISIIMAIVPSLGKTMDRSAGITAKYGQPFVAA